MAKVRGDRRGVMGLGAGNDAPLIREARATDYPRVAELFHEMHGPLPVPPFEEWVAQLASHTLCLERDGQVEGYVLGFGNAPSGHISQIAVDREARGQGFGRALMLAMAQRFLRQGCTSWDLHVETKNEAARGLYLQLGLIETHRSTWVQLGWEGIADLAGRVGAQPATVRDLPPARDAEVERLLGLAPGRLGGCRQRPGARLLALHDPSARGALGVAAYSPQVQLVAPLRAPTPEQAVILLASLAEAASGESVRIVVDDQHTLVLLLKGAGGEVVYDSFHMKGALLDAR